MGDPPSVDQSWFEMERLRVRSLDAAAWIPLRARVSDKGGEHARAGEWEEFFGAGSLAVPEEHRDLASGLGWTGLGIQDDHGPIVVDGEYVPADVYLDYENGPLGTHLVLEMRGNSSEPREWILHHDLVLGLRLKREGDEWVAFEEGYEVAARLERDDEGAPVLIEIRAEYLKDYLTATGSALLVTTYRRRWLISETTDLVDWPDGKREEGDAWEWEGHVLPIHEGSGMPYGESWTVVHASQTDVDPEEDVPLQSWPNDSNVETREYEGQPVGRRLYRIEGELWKDDWVEQSGTSPRIKGDEEPPQVRFTVDASGKTEQSADLADVRRWLWFKPEVVPVLIDRRGGSLSWYTLETGSVRCSPGHGVHFGVNTEGLITVYAKDIARLPEWQQKIWAGFNSRPDGKVSAELLMSQVEARPASTRAPEELFARGLDALNALSESKLGFPILRPHDEASAILRRTHRFRATDRAGLFALAKDVARLTADSIDASAICNYLGLSGADRRQSLKAMEKLVAHLSTEEKAHEVMGPLVGAYNLRLGDAHLPRTDIDEAFQLVHVDPEQPFVTQGREMLRWCASSVRFVVETLRTLDGDLDAEGEPPLERGDPR